jgi:hypothetical protein
VRGELAEDRRVRFRVAIAIAAEDVQRANRALLVQQRHRERRRHAGHDADVVRIHRHVAEHDALLRGEDATDQALAGAQLESRRSLG